MNSKAVKVLLALLSLLLLVNIGYQVYQYIYNPYKTEVAMSYQIEDEVRFDGVFFREETLLQESPAGVVESLYPNGSKVIKGACIAYVFDSEETADKYNRIEQCREQISLLTQAQSADSAENTHLDSLNTSVSEKFFDVSAAVHSGDLEEAQRLQAQLDQLLLHKQVVTKKVTGYQDTIAQLEAEIDSLGSDAVLSPKQVTASESGYYVDQTDGYEGTLTTDSLADITVQQLQEIVQKPSLPQDKQYVGKVVTDFRYQIAAVVPQDDLAYYAVNDEIDLTISGVRDKMQATISEIRVPEGSSDAIVIISCDRMNEEVSQLRTAQIVMSNAAYQGIRIPAEAVRYQDEVAGVYVIENDTIVFKKLDILFRNDVFVLSRAVQDDAYVAVYDEVVVRGKDLYDQKPVTRK